MAERLLGPSTPCRPIDAAQDVLTGPGTNPQVEPAAHGRSSSTAPIPELNMSQDMAARDDDGDIPDGSRDSGGQKSQRPVGANSSRLSTVQERRTPFKKMAGRCSYPSVLDGKSWVASTVPKALVVVSPPRMAVMTHLRWTPVWTGDVAGVSDPCWVSWYRRGRWLPEGNIAE
jgi:hypothetical protein